MESSSRTDELPFFAALESIEAMITVLHLHALGEKVAKYRPVTDRVRQKNRARFSTSTASFKLSALGFLLHVKFKIECGAYRVDISVTWFQYVPIYCARKKRCHTNVTESEKESNRKSRRFYRFGGGATRLIPALVVVVVPAFRAALLAVAPVTPGRGLVLGGGGFVVVLLLVVPRPPAGGGGLVGDVGGSSFCRFDTVFSLSSPAAVAVRVLVAGFVGTFS